MKVKDWVRELDKEFGPVTIGRENSISWQLGLSAADILSRKNVVSLHIRRRSKPRVMLHCVLKPQRIVHSSISNSCIL